MGKRRAIPVFLLLCILIFSGASCERETEKPYKGQIVLSSAFDFVNATTRGYNFEEHAFAEFPATSGDPPDIIIENFKRVDAPPKPGFTSPSNNYGFALVDEFSGLEQSLAFFGDYETFDTSAGMTPNTDTVRLYQVWVLRTRLDRYVKIHVRDIDNFSDMTGDYVEVTVDYVYQDDGTAVFPE